MDRGNDMSEFADAIYYRYQRNNLSETLEYYEHHRELLERRENIIHTIGVSYRRMYDGGVEKVLSSLLHIWTKMNYTVVLFTEEEPDFRDYYYPEGVQRVVLPPVEKLKTRLRRLEDELRVRKIDIFIQNTWQSEVVLWDMLLVKSHHIPFVIYTHGHFTAMYTNADDYALASNRVFTLADQVIALSDTNEKFYQLCGCRVMQIENPIAGELRTVCPVYSSSDNHHILWIGRIAEGKRLNDALRIFAEVKKRIPDAVLDIVGSGAAADEKNARYLCDELRIGSSVHFCGYQKTVNNYYRDCAVMLMTSEKEGYPTVLLECKAYGRSCVMYSLPYLSLVKDGKGVRTTTIGDIFGMAELLCTVLLDSQLRRALEDGARESFAELCRYDHIAKWEEIFGNLSKIEDNRTGESQDGLMLKMLLDTLRKGIEMRMKHSFEYQIGEKLLRIPRAVLRMFRREGRE